MKSRLFRAQRSHHGSLTELNITPLLDLVFVLLVIFIITTPQLTNSLEINLPSGKPPPKQKAKPPAIHHIAIESTGQLTLDSRPISLTSLKNELSLLKSSLPDLAVVVESSDDAEYQQVIQVFDLLQQLEIKKVGLATEVLKK